MSEPIYLDYNATTPVAPEVVDAMLPWLTTHFGNPSSDHPFGRAAKQAVEHARGQVAALRGCSVAEIVFTSGGTEANNLAIMGSCHRHGRTRSRLVTSTVEHPAVARPFARLGTEGFTVVHLPVDGEGMVLPDAAREQLSDDTLLVSVMLANNETGTIMPLAEIAGLAHEHGAIVHTDAAQAVGKIPVSVAGLGVDLLSIAGHKLYAPKGVGALFMREGTQIDPVLLGAGHEHGLRPGTENVPYLVGLGVACELASRKLEEELNRIGSLRDRLFGILSAGIPGLRLNGHSSERLPNTLNVSFPNVSGNHILAAAPGLAASTGSACHEGVDAPSSVLLAMGLEPATALGAVRLSLGRGTTVDQIEEAAQFLIQSWQSLVPSS